MELLPGDSLRTVFSFLPRWCLYSCICTSKAWCSVARSNALWSELYIRDFGAYQPSSGLRYDDKIILADTSSDSTTSEEEEVKDPRIPIVPKHDAFVLSIISSIVDMGFSQAHAERAWWETRNTKNAQAAVEWLFAHMDDLDNISNPPPLTDKQQKVNQQEDNAVFQLSQMFPNYSKKSIRVALRMNGDVLSREDGQQALGEWIIENDEMMETLNNEYQDDDPEEELIDPSNKPALDLGTDMMEKYHLSYEKTLTTKVYVNSKYVKKDPWDAPATITITTGLRMPAPVPVLPFPDSFSTGIFVEYDISIVPPEEREAVRFAICYLLRYAQPNAKEPTSMEDLPEQINAEIRGNILHTVTFFNPVCAVGEEQSVDGIEYFLKTKKKQWSKSWNPPRDNPGSRISPGQKFLLFLIYKNTKEYTKKYKNYSNRKNYATKKKKVGGFESTPYEKTRPLTARVAQSLTQWYTLAHLGMPLLNKDGDRDWQNVETVLDSISKHKIFVNELKVMNRFGSSGILEFSDRPAFKHLFVTPSWYRATEETARYKELIKIESEIGSYWD